MWRSLRPSLQPPQGNLSMKPKRRHISVWPRNVSRFTSHGVVHGFLQVSLVPCRVLGQPSSVTPSSIRSRHSSSSQFSQSWLCSRTFDWWFRLRRPSSRIHGNSKLVEVNVDQSSGVKKVNGKAKQLKRSGEYPLKFGLALAALLAPTDSPSSSLDWGWQNRFMFDPVASVASRQIIEWFRRGIKTINIQRITVCEIATCSSQLNNLGGLVKYIWWSHLWL